MLILPALIYCFDILLFENLPVAAISRADMFYLPFFYQCIKPSLNTAFMHIHNICNFSTSYGIIAFN